MEILRKGLIQLWRCCPLIVLSCQRKLASRKAISFCFHKKIQFAIDLLFKCYHYIVSPFLGPRCRFYPSCSCYAQEALETHGLLKGAYLTVKRLLKCHPLCDGGVDLVPPKKENK